VIPRRRRTGEGKPRLTGLTLDAEEGPTPEQWNAYLLMQQAVLAAVDPSPQQSSWVEQALARWVQIDRG
jgi:hypothetical protein